MAPTRPLTWTPTALPEIRRCMVETSQYIVDQYADMGVDSMHRRLRAQPGVPPDLKREVVESLAVEEAALLESFRAAELYWVTPPMIDLAADAATDLPEWIPGLEAPAPQGIIAFAESLPATVHSTLSEQYLLSGVSSDFRVDALSWWIHQDRIMVTFLSRFDRTTPSMALRPGELVPFHSMLLPADKPVKVPDKLVASDDVQGLGGGLVHLGRGVVSFDPAAIAATLHLLGAAWILMATTTVAESRKVTGSGSSRRAVKHLGRSVTVISLRRLRHVSTGSVSPSGRTYTHRWVVRGHWRNQAYGPGRALHRPVFVPPFTKGPDGAPLLRNERVFVWRR